MNESREYISYLWQQLIDDKATMQEMDDLISWLTRHPGDEFSLNFLENQMANHQQTDTGDREHWAEKLKMILQSDSSSKKPGADRVNLRADLTKGQKAKSAHVIRFTKTTWFKYAAAVLVVFSIGVYLWYNKEMSNPETAQSKPVPVQNDISPGSEKAILTLSNGKKLELTGEAVTIEEAGAIISSSNGELKYGKTGEVVVNTMTTPRGGQYKLILPDGSGVWLNAASSVTYPTSFRGEFRTVSVTGEAYFEITKDRTHPFIVKTNNSEILVLGTSFNVNDYAEDDGDVAHTTLIEGSLKISAKNIARVLTPGQQAAISGNNIMLTDNIDLEKVLAWKNGEMVLSESTTRRLMQEISRWYDVDIEYRGKVPDRKFFGSVSRSVPLSSILSVLKAYGINTSLEGKKLIVL